MSTIQRDQEQIHATQIEFILSEPEEGEQVVGQTGSALLTEK